MFTITATISRNGLGARRRRTFHSTNLFRPIKIKIIFSYKYSLAVGLCYVNCKGYVEANAIARAIA